MKVYKIDKCEDCPLIELHEAGKYTCTLVYSNPFEELDKNTILENCPLKNESILIEIKE